MGLFKKNGEGGIVPDLQIFKNDGKSSEVRVLTQKSFFYERF